MQGIGVVATGVQGEDLDTRLPGVSDQGSGQRPTDAMPMGSSIYRDLLQIGVWPMGRSGVAEPVPQPHKSTVEVSGTQGRIPGLYCGNDVAEKFRHLIPRGRIDPAQRGTSTDQVCQDLVCGLRKPDLQLWIGSQPHGIKDGGLSGHTAGRGRSHDQQPSAVTAQVRREW
ncbi:hypothetical protein GCM10012285_11950 [Streptomyces kronopolitis]|uniref:Uncharacterized protein n=1 Tax=Streptomyces kronopolitis TaxID=1612435 RepID=A0ABQ2J4C0_9ACTN|nr:hypothetical protein GCM10012285_11950 [Streptomyces kronopolitis]